MRLKDKIMNVPSNVINAVFYEVESNTDQAVWAVTNAVADVDHIEDENARYEELKARLQHYRAEMFKAVFGEAESDVPDEIVDELHNQFADNATFSNWAMDMAISQLISKYADELSEYEWKYKKMAVQQACRVWDK